MSVVPGFNWGDDHFDSHLVVSRGKGRVESEIRRDDFVRKPKFSGKSRKEEIAPVRNVVSKVREKYGYGADHNRGFSGSFGSNSGF